MRRALLNVSAVLAGGFLSLAGLAFSFVVAFFAMFYGLRVVCLLTKNDDWMLLMWLGIVFVPVGGLLIFALAGIGLVACIDWRLDRKKPRGFEVAPDPAPRNDG